MVSFLCKWYNILDTLPKFSRIINGKSDVTAEANSINFIYDVNDSILKVRVKIYNKVLNNYTGFLFLI